MQKIWALIAAAAVVFAGLPALATAQEAPVLTIEVSEIPGAIVLGDTVTFDVSSTPSAPGAAASLERRILPTGSWHIVGNATLDDTGATTFTAKPNSYKSFEFRVAVQGDDGSWVRSSTQAVTVVATAEQAVALATEVDSDAISVSDIPSHILLGDRISITVTTDPAAPGVPARLERRILPTGSWHTVGNATLDDTGSATFTAKPNSYKSFEFRVAIDAMPTVRSRTQAVSVVTTLPAEPPEPVVELEPGDDSVVVTDVPSDILLGTTVSFTVTTNPPTPGLPVRLERRILPTGSWHTVGNTTLDDTGSATFTAKPNSYKSFEFRIAIDAEPTVVSRTQTVTVVTSLPPGGGIEVPPGSVEGVSVTDLPATLILGNTITITVTTDPPAPGVPARFERRILPGGSWHTVGNAVLDDTGSATFTAKPNSYKSFEFRVAVDGNPTVRSRAQTVKVVAGAPNTSYTPSNGALFNNPFTSAKHRISIRIETAINATPTGETIRLSMYSFSRPASLRAIRAAYNRGVNVQVVLNDHDITYQIAELRRLLGTNPNKPSFAVVCNDGCRTGARGNQHMKFLAITATGGKQDVLLTTSGNLTYAGGAWQWNDLLTVVDRPTLYRNFVEIFDQMAQDSRVPNPYRYVSDGPYTAEFLPTQAGKSNDPIWRELQKVSCRTTATGYGRNGRTVVQVAMWTWRGTRGMYLAQKLRQLDADGCYVEVVVGAPSYTVLRELRRTGPNGGIAVRDSRMEYSQNGYDGEPSFTKGSHQKYLLINGRYGSSNGERRVLTGSLNWTDGALTNGDEMVVQVDSNAHQRSYEGNFKTMFNNRKYTKVLRNY